MSTKKTSETKNTYNPAAMGTFNALQPGIQSNLQDDMQLDPTKSNVFNLMLGQSMGAANQLGLKNIQNTIGRVNASGFGEGSPFAQSQTDKAMRMNSGLQAQAFIQNLFAADQRRQNATTRAMGYQPLQTGQNNVTTTSGLGTWLPQVAGMGLSAAMGGLGGGLFGAMKGGGAGGASGGGGFSMPSSLGGWGGTSGSLGGPFQAHF